MQSKNAKSDRNFFDLRIRLPKLSDFGPQSDDVGHHFSNRKMACSLNSRCYPRQQTAAERSMSWIVTQLCSDVASRPTLGRRAARPSVARLQSPGAGSGLETKRSALGTHLFADTYEYTWTTLLYSSSSQSQNATQNTKTD